jgi:hypothetical protein
MSRFSEVFVSVWYPSCNFVQNFHFSHAWYTHCPPHPLWCVHPHNVWCIFKSWNFALWLATSYNIHVSEVPWSSCLHVVLFGTRRWENTIIFEYHKCTENIYYLEGRDTKIILWNKCSMKIATLAKLGVLISFWNWQYSTITLIIKPTRCTNFSNLFLE